jgi:uncharacterized OB-fold protein
MISCQACGHGNPLGRVFCQKCGTKLDLTKIRAPGGGEGAGGVTIGVRKDDDKKKSPLKIAIRIFDIVLILAVIAVLVLVWLEPTVKGMLNSPSEAEKVKLEREKLEFAISAKRSYKFSISDIGLNSYLLNVAEVQKSIGDDKLALVPEQNLVAVVYIRKFRIGGFEKNIVMQYVGEPVVDAGEFRFRPVRGSLGKLPVPGFALGLYERNFARVFQNFGDERALLAQLTSIQVDPQKVTLSYEAPK